METATQLLHRLTSYEPGREWDAHIDDPRVVQDIVSNDMATLPWFYKRYEQALPRSELPREWPTTEPGCFDILAGTPRPGKSRLDLQQLSRLLHLSAGVTRTIERPWGTHIFRAAGSAGGRFPLELYLAIPEGSELPAGVHWYHPQEHALLRVGPPPGGGSPALIVSGVPWRTGWRYFERGYRHIYWDAGTMLAQTLAAADAAGISANLYTKFPDEAVGALIGADGVHEWPVAVVALGERAPALELSGAAAVGAVDGAPREFPLATSAQRAGRATALGAPWARGASVEAGAATAASVDEVILRRGSQRRMDPAGRLSLSLLRASMTVAMRGIAEPHFLAVHKIDGLGPGIYRWPDLDSPRRSGDLRGELYHVALEQNLASEAAFVVIGATNISRLDDHEYRETHLAAGLVEGRLHLAAYALGASASGMTFLDYEIRGLLGEDLDGLLFTCVGVPEYRSAPGGGPGAPTRVRRVVPRTS